MLSGRTLASIHIADNVANFSRLLIRNRLPDDPRVRVYCIAVLFAERADCGAIDDSQHSNTQRKSASVYG